MNALLILFILFVLALLLVSGKTGLKNLAGLLLNLGVLFILILLIAWKFNALLCLVVASLLILALAIFLSSDNDKVTSIAFKASLIVVLGLGLLAIFIQTIGQFQGFDSQDTEALEGLSLSVGLNFSNLAIVVMILSMLGAVAEAAMAVTTDLSELTAQHPDMTVDALASHRNLVSQQILGTAINTLFFGMLGSSIALILWMVRLNYSSAQLFNSKLLMMAVVTMLLGMLGILLVIWLCGHYVIMDFRKSKSD